MDKDLDYEIYSDIDDMLGFEGGSMHQRKVVNSRILKLSSAKSRSAYAALGMAFSETGQAQKSIFPLRKLTIVSPVNTKAQIRLAESLLKLERDDECLNFLKKALVLSPEFGPLRILIETLEKNNRLQELEDFTKEIANKIADPTSLQEFYIFTGEVLREHKEYPQALANYKKATEINPTMDEYYHYNYGIVLYSEGLFEEAIVQFGHTWRLDPTEKLAFNNIVHLNYCLGNIEKALEGFEEIIKDGLEVYYTYSNYILVLYHLDKDEEEINKYKDLLQPYIQSHGEKLLKVYQEELRITQTILQEDNIDVQTKELNLKKIKGINKVLSFIN